MKTITRIICRHSFACFTVEDCDGDRFIVQLAWSLEELWQLRKATA